RHWIVPFGFRTNVIQLERRCDSGVQWFGLVQHDGRNGGQYDKSSDNRFCAGQFCRAFDYRW
ncbi:hypothetical protein RZS08_08315, partial [Arthrospira platensis SPKY1]|nr:hypothetical protein [Arthrospira platensis SPKY1]